MDIKGKIKLRNQLYKLVQTIWDLYAVQRDDGMADDHPEQVALVDQIVEIQMRTCAIDNVMRCIVNGTPEKERWGRVEELRIKIHEIKAETDKATRLMKSELFVLQDCLRCDSFENPYASRRCQTPPICNTFD